MRTGIFSALSAIVLGVFPFTAEAVVLDWDNVTWVPGSTTQEFNVDGVAGNDIRITISGNTERLLGGSPNEATGAGGIAGSSLQIAADWENRTESVTVTIDFLGIYATQGVLVDFTLIDIDALSSGNQTGRYMDMISSISGSSPSDSAFTIPATLVSNGAMVAVDGSGNLSGTGQNVDTSAGGNAALKFEQYVDQIRFTFGSTPSSGSQPVNPAAQNIFLSDITFSTTPEVGPTWAAMILCGLALGTHRFRKFCIA